MEGTGMKNIAELHLLESSFDEAVFVDGLPLAEVNAGIRRVYDEGEAAGAPFAVTRAKMLAYTLANAHLAVNKADAFAGVVERQYLDKRYGVGEIARIQWERAANTAKRGFPEKYDRTTNVRFVDLDRAHQDWIIREAEGSGA